MLEVDEIFASFQCEGKRRGTPAAFVRLWGCNLSCPFCDTPQAGDAPYTATPAEIVSAVKPLTEEWVIITGGEPTIQEELSDLVVLLKAEVLKVAIESNGTIDVDWQLFDWVCISPKFGTASPNALAEADEIKWLVGDGGLSLDGWVHAEIPYPEKASFQPIWGVGYYENLRAAMQYARAFGGVLSIQEHKYIRIK
jgi:organic radical activating enzyme